MQCYRDLRGSVGGAATTKQNLDMTGELSLYPSLVGEINCHEALIKMNFCGVRQCPGG